MIRRLLRDRPLRDAVKRAHYRATVPDPTWTPEEAFDAWLRERENVDRMTAAFHGAQDKLRTARRACDHWKARAEHLASEKAEADMRASVFRANKKYWLAAYFKQVDHTYLLLWLHAESQWKLRAGIPQDIGFMADTINGGPAGVTVGKRRMFPSDLQVAPNLGVERDFPCCEGGDHQPVIKTWTPRQWTKRDPEPDRGEFIADVYGRQWVRDGHGWVRWADTHRIWKQWDEMAFPVVEVLPPSEREGDKQ